MKALWLVKLLDPPTLDLCSVEVRMTLEVRTQIKGGREAPDLSTRQPWCG